MLKITFFTCFGFPHGTYFRWHNLAIGLLHLGHQVTVITLDAPAFKATKTEIRDGITYRLIPTTPLLQRIFRVHLDPITLLRTIRSSPPKSDVYHVFQPFPSSCLPALIHRRNARCLIYDWDDLWVGGLWPKIPLFPLRKGWVPRAVKLMEHRMPGWSDAVTTCGSYLAEEAQRRGAHSVEIIHNGFWPDQAYPTKADARRELGLHPDAFYFGLMGRTQTELEWCVDALRTETASDTAPRLALCGMSEAAVDALPGQFRSRIDYCGELSPEQARSFARALDCGLLPLEDTPFNQSRFPIKFADYLAAGAHVITSDIGEIARLGQDHPNVTLAGTTRDQWKSCLTQTDLPKRLASRPPPSSPTLDASFDWLQLASTLETFYRKTLAEKSS